MYRPLYILLALGIMFTPLSVAARTKIGIASAVVPNAQKGMQLEKLEVITIGDDLLENMHIKTDKGGRTQILFIDGSSMNIAPNSRIIIDKFVFDAEQARGTLSAKIEHGSMRFIGGVLSKRKKQVELEADGTIIGIRGGIAHIDLTPSGALSAQLIHGQLTFSTPKQTYITQRVGTEIARTRNGTVSIGLSDIESVNKNLAAESREAIAKTPPAENKAPHTNKATPKLGDMLDAPQRNRLVERGKDNKLLPTKKLEKLDPRTAELVTRGALKLDKQGRLRPTELLLKLDATSRQALAAGLLTIDPQGFLVPSAKGLTESTRLLKEDPKIAKLYQEGKLVIDPEGKLVVASPLRRAAQQDQPTAIIKDKPHDDALLKHGRVLEKDEMAWLSDPNLAARILANPTDTPSERVGIPPHNDSEKFTPPAQSNTARTDLAEQTRPAPDVNFVMHIGFMQSREPDKALRREARNVPNQNGAPVKWRPSHTPRPNRLTLGKNNAQLDIQIGNGDDVISSGDAIALNPDTNYQALALTGYDAKIDRHYKRDNQRYSVFTDGKASLTTMTVDKFRPATAPRDITFCDCPHMAVGIWRANNFSNPPDNTHRYDGLGLVALAPTSSSDDLRAISTLRATLRGHAIGHVVNTAQGVQEYNAYGNVEISFDMLRNTHSFRLSNFDKKRRNWDSGKLAVRLAHDGQYRGATNNFSLNGQLLFDSKKNPSTLGSFALDLAEEKNYSAAGIFVAE